MTLVAVEVQQPLVGGNEAVMINPCESNGNTICHNTRMQNQKLCTTKILSVTNDILTTVIYITITWLTIVILCGRLGVDPMKLVLFVSLIAASYLSGRAFQFCGLPHVVPMYLIGSTFRTSGVYDNYVDWTIFSNLRYLAVTVILVKSGLSLNIKDAKKYSSEILKSSFVISTVEALTLTIAACLFLPDIFPPLWALVFGFVNSATSPTKFASTLAVLKVKKKYSYARLQAVWGFSAPIEIIYCISVFSVLMSVIVGRKGNEIQLSIFSVGYVTLGFVAGLAWGVVVGYFPRKDDINSPTKRFIGLWMGVISIYFGAKLYGWGPGGPLGAFVGGISANTAWTMNHLKKKSVLQSFNRLWDWVMEPMLFALVGYEISLDNLPMSKNDIFISIGCLCIGILLRCLISVATHYTSGFNYREIAFLTMSGVPKATVQAAIAPQLLDLLRGTDLETRAKALILTSILTTLIFTTLSTLFLHLFSRRLLKGTHDKPSLEVLAEKKLPIAS